MIPSPELRDLRPHWRTALTIHVLFALLRLAALAPLMGVLLRALLALSGEPALADQEIALLLLQPAGFAGAILLAGLWLAILALELGALTALAVGADHGRPPSAADASLYAIRHANRLLRVTVEVVVKLLLCLLPWLITVGLLAWLVLSSHDINYYLAQRPPEFLIAIAVAVCLALPVLWLMLGRLLNWSLALPLLLFSDVPAGRVLKESRRLTTFHRREVLAALAGWLIYSLIALALPALFVTLAGGWVAELQASRLTPLVLLLGTIALGWVALNLLAGTLVSAGFCFAINRIFVRLAPEVADEVVARKLAERPQRVPGRLSTRGALLALAVFAGAAAGAGLFLLNQLPLEDKVAVVAHRGAAGAAPENTLAAVRRAIADGAEWVEIDVQESRDGTVVVVHDSDFMKLAGNPVKVWEADLAQLKEIDIGSWFDPKFSDQRVPTLAEVLEEVRGRARLVIELKYYGHDVALEERVVDAVEAAGMADQVAVMSLKLAGVRKLKTLRPDWPTGLLAATALGDLTRLEVDFLAVNGGIASRNFLRRARAAGKPVYVWTVNSAMALSTWISRGVDGVITDEPALARQVLQERARLGAGERLMINLATLFGQPPELQEYRDNSP